MKNLVILGSTGSIGTQALKIAEQSEDINIVGLGANKNIKLLEEQIRRFKPLLAVVSDEKEGMKLKESVKDTNTKVLVGSEALIELCTIKCADMVLTSVVGIAGLLPTIAAIKAKKEIALANKETLVCAGDLVMGEALKNGVKIMPVDSEHGAIFQCLEGNDRSLVKKIILTASGGPFFKKTKEELKNITIEEALSHPNWSMGSKITIDSATMMNKGFEFIEAKHLFGLKDEQIEVCVHRQSIVHSMVEYIDNSIIAQLGEPDMTLPISYAIFYPKRVKSPAKELDIFKMGNLSFEKPDYVNFPCLSLAMEASKTGGTMPAVLNGANEVLVDLFLKGQISFLDISDINKQVMSKYKSVCDYSISDVLDADRFARETVLELVKR